MPNHPNRSRRQTLLRQLRKRWEKSRESRERNEPGTRGHTNSTHVMRRLECQIAALEAGDQLINASNYEPTTAKPDTTN